MEAINLTAQEYAQLMVYLPNPDSYRPGGSNHKKNPRVAVALPDQFVDLLDVAHYGTPPRTYMSVQKMLEFEVVMTGNTWFWQPVKPIQISPVPTKTEQS